MARKPQEIRKELKQVSKQLNQSIKQFRKLVKELETSPRFSWYGEANRPYIGSGASDPLYNIGWQDGFTVGRQPSSYYQGEANYRRGY